MISENLQEIVNKLQTNGWINKEVGYYKSGIQIKKITGFECFIKDQKIDNFLEKLSKPKSANQHKIRLSGVGSDSTMGSPKADVTPRNGLVVDSESDSATLPVLANFDNYPSFVAARPDKPCILIGFDSEWENISGGGRDMLSWQFAVVWGSKLVEICFLKTGTVDLSFDVAMGCILDYLGVSAVDVRKIRRYMYCTDWDNDDDKPVVAVTDDVNVARSNCKYIYRGSYGEVDGWCHKLIDDMPDKFVSRSNRDWAWFHTFLDFNAVDSVKVTLLCHTGLVDISGFDKSDYILRHLTSVQGGLVSLQPIRLGVKSLLNVNNPSYYPVSLNVADTMCHAPAGHKKLDQLGAVVGIPKIDVDVNTKSHMLQFLINDPIYYMEYASRDSVVTLLYCSALYGYNNTPPVTVTSATATVMKGIIMNYMGLNSNDGFNSKYRGLRKISHGKVMLSDRPGYLEASSLEPMSDKVHTVQYYTSQAYHGGYNSCSEVGYFSQETYDYDLKNAYPTAMCLVPDIDWCNPIKFQIQDRYLDISDFLMFGNVFNPLAPFVCYCRFEFPKDIKYPCIPVNVDGIPVYPLSSDGLAGVYVGGPYIYLALRLGAKVYCETGYFLNTLLTDDLTESRSLSSAVLQLVQDRNRAKIECGGVSGEKSLEELILKTMVNSGYGKIAQNVVEKQTWTAFKNVMDSLGCSAITNPFSAMMITAIVQCELLAAQNQIHDLGFMTCSVTTDGFISDCPFDVLKQIDLYGFRQFMTQARLFLTGDDDPELWEIKHHQNDLINFTTRGNVSLHQHGVCAHNSAKSGFESDSYDDRLWLMTQVLSRTGTVACTDNVWTTFKEVVQGKPFKVTPTTRNLHMDFDLKRKPDRDTFITDYPVVDGVKYEIAHFDTVPYADVAEFRLYRRKKKLCDCLRTEEEWNTFFVKIDTNASGMNVKDLDWSIIMSIIMGYRAGKWDIPALNNKTVVEKCDWINKHNDSKKQFNRNDWKNARRPERQVNMLPKSYLLEKLEEMQNDIS